MGGSIQFYFRPARVFAGDAGCFIHEPKRKRRQYRRIWSNPSQNTGPTRRKYRLKKPCEHPKGEVSVDPSVIAQLPETMQTRGMARQAQKGNENAEKREGTGGRNKKALGNHS